MEIFNQGLWAISVHDEYEKSLLSKALEKKNVRIKEIKLLPALFIPPALPKPEIRTPGVV